MANQLTNPLRGVGTTGTVAKWSSPTTIGDSILTDSGTAISSSGPIRATGTSAAAPAFTGSDTDTGVYFPAANQVRIATAGTLAIAVDASQNVGIGTASPQEKLQVYGDLKVGVLASGSYISLGDEATTNRLIGIFRAPGDTLLGVGGYAGIKFTVGAVSLGSQTERMRIDATGSVGMGMTNPSERLEVGGGIRVSGAANVATAALAVPGVLSLEYPITRLYIGDGTGYRFSVSKRGGSVTTDMLSVLDATGNVGIGTASPTGRLHVVGGTAAAATNGAPVTIIAQSAGTGNQNGGNIVLTPGALSGTGSAGVADLSGPTGTGLKLPATPGNADSQTLDCYAEGTWTPTLSAAASWGGTQPTVSVARYVRIGSTVHCTVVLVGAPNFSSVYLATTITAPFSATYNAAVPISSGATAFGCAQHNAGGTTLFLPTFGVVGAATFSWTFIV